MPAAIRSAAFPATPEPADRLAKKDLFFIGGMAKSGTTWLQILLDNHPAISCEGESHLLSHFGKGLIDTVQAHNAFLQNRNSTVFQETADYNGFSDDDLAILLRTAYAALLGKQRKFAEAAIVGEKTPDNILNTALIWRLFPRAKFIHMVRDGRDVAVSGWFHNLRTNADWLHANHTSFDAYAMTVAREWTHCMRMGQDAADHQPNQCHTLRYRDLLQQPHETLQRVLQFLGANHDQNTIKRCLRSADFAKLSGGRTRGQNDDRSFFRSGVAGGWREHFSDTLHDAFVVQTAPWLKRFGFLDPATVPF